MKSTKLAILFTFIIGLTILGNKYEDNKSSENPSTPKEILSNDCKTTISGKILDKETKTPVTDALVTLISNGQEIKLINVNKNGEYNFKVNCGIQYKLVVKAASYFKFEFNLTTEKDKSIPIFKNFLLEKACYQTITGTVFNEFSNKAINNATVTLYLNGEEIETTQVDKIGVYSFRAKCNSNYYIVVNKLNFTNDLFEFTTSNISNKSIKHNFKLEPECIQTLSGIIKNKITLEPMSATLKLYLNNIEIETLHINNDGKFFVKFQCTTNYKIVASKLDYKNDSYNFLTDYTENKQPNYFHLKKDLYLEPNQCFKVVSGKVLNKQTKQSISNAKVSLNYQNQEIKTFETNLDGSYLFNIKCDATYDIIASKEGMSTETINYIASEKKGEDKLLNIYLEDINCEQIVNGTILDKNTKLPVAKAKVTLMQNNAEVNSVTTSDNGTYSFTINCAAAYKIEASNSDYSTNSTSFSSDKTRDTSITKTIELIPLDCNQIVNGTILDKNTKLPIANAKVILMQNNAEVNEVTTSDNGTYSFTINCDAAYKIEASNSNYNPNSISFSSDKTREASITKTIELIPLDCNQIVNGTILDKNTKLPIANAKVTLMQNNAEVNAVTTSDNGTYSFTINCDAAYKIEASNSDYNANSISFSSDKTRDNNISKSIELLPLDCNQIVNGTILDKNTKLPITNAKVTLMQNNAEVNSVITSDNGTYNFTINCDVAYKIEASNSDYNANSISFSSDKTRDNSKNITIELNKKECKQQVTGIIRDKISKKPLPNTTITLYQNNKVMDTKIVGENGEYQFELKCATTYKLSVFKNNAVESFRIKTAIENGRILHLNFDIEPLKCVQYVNGIVTESITKNAIPGAKIKLLDGTKEVKSTLSDSNGTFYFELDCNKNYTVSTTKTNYTSTKETVNTFNKIGHPHNMSLVLEPIIKAKEKNGVKYIETKSINFELDEFKLTNDAKFELNKVVFNLNQNPTFKLEINYYTDSRGPDKYNMELTQKRANASKDYLISKGIDASRIKAKGFGETKLLNRCKNNVKCTDAEHAINKRADFIIIPN